MIVGNEVMKDRLMYWYVVKILDLVILVFSGIGCLIYLIFFLLIVFKNNWIC